MPKNNRLGLDLEPKNNEIIKMDFNDFEINRYSDVINNKKVITIGNPPFGKNSSLALKFINKSALYSDVIAFILPKTFKKESMLSKINKNLHLIKEFELPRNSFVFENESYNVPCIFQIWEKRVEERIIVKSTLIHNDFVFTTPDFADFAIRRVGGLAGKLIEDFKDYSTASHYYIKASKSVKNTKKVFKKINWDNVKNNTVGNPSISKRELIRLYSDNM